MIKLMEVQAVGRPLGDRARQDRWADGVPTSIRAPVGGGLIVLGLFLAGFGLWAATAPLSGAVVASGIVQASGQNQIVQHLEGGIISKIRVGEGDLVNAGQVIVSLDKTRVLAERDRVGTAILLARAKLERARAELDDRQTLDFSPEVLADARRQGLEEELKEQRAEFQSRLERHRSELAAIDQRIKATDEEIGGFEIQNRSEAQNLEILRDELADKRKLLEMGLTLRAQYNVLQRTEADTIGRIGALTASIGQRRASIAELADQGSTLRARRREAAAQQINELRTAIGDLREQLQARDDVLSRAEIRAPVDGVIVKLNKNTVGGTVQPGEMIAEILPAQNERIVEAKISPRDIDTIQVGQRASLRLVAANTRMTPELPARVTYLSADRLIETVTQEPYYTARLAVDTDRPGAIAIEQIHPGMPVDVLINTGERTFLEYLIRPIRDSLAKAFREE